MKKLALVCLAVLAIGACSRVPITGRKQFNVLPNSMVMEMSLTSYREFLTQHPPVPSGNTNTLLVKKVGQNVSVAVDKYMRAHGYADRVAGYNWEFNLADVKEVNAWCMPGGKVMVYTGILPYTKDETGLAVVMSHEIAHAIAEHGNERMSQQLAVALGGLSLEIALKEKPQQTHDLFMLAYGVGSTLGTLAYSRQHELEADKLGLDFMAMAGYDPRKAVDFWVEMSKQGGAKPPEFLSTHPSDATRIKAIKSYLPEAMKYYQFKK